MDYPEHTGHTPTPDMAPDLGEVQQVEDPSVHLVPVEVCGPIEARELPTKRLSARTVPVGTSAGVKLLSVDPRRKFATIIGRTQDLRIGATQSEAQMTGAWLPGVVPLQVTTVAELWAIGDGASTDVSVIEEYWA
ncbi:MAG: hypothetical protein LC723_06355 [Actinobacteria bacterium]|nr:hypothetical protein [Actinomycetota bacterium]